MPSRCSSSTTPMACRRRSAAACSTRSSELNQLQHQAVGDPETLTRIAQYEMAYRMQASVPELTDLSAEPASVYDLYGEDARRAGSFAQCCLTARRLLERGTQIRADLAERLGRACQRHGPSAESVPGRRPGVLRLRAGPEAARHARRHAAGVGRRVRPHDLLAREADADQLWPGSPPAMLHHVDGGGGCQGRNRVWRNGRFLVQHRERSSSRAGTFRRRFFISSASITRGSRTGIRVSM